jgi:hypothetical protein
LELVACIGARAGVLRGVGSSFAQDYETSSPWFEPGAQIGPRLRLGSTHGWLIQLLAGAGVPIIRDTFIYHYGQDELRMLHRAGWIIGRLELAGGVSF